MTKPNFRTMPRKALIQYVLANRDDEEAFRVLVDRRSPDEDATWYNFPMTEDGQRQMAEVFRRKLNGEL